VEKAVMICTHFSSQTVPVSWNFQTSELAQALEIEHISSRRSVFSSYPLLVHNDVPTRGDNT